MLLVSASSPSPAAAVVMGDGDLSQLPFTSISYIPFGDSKCAPLVATPPAVIRRVFELLKLQNGDVLLDLGCGQGHVLNQISLMFTATAASSPSSGSSVRIPPVLHCIGVDNNAEFLSDAIHHAECLRLSNMSYKLVDFGLDTERLLSRIVQQWRVTKAYLYITTRQLMLPAVRLLLTGMYNADIPLMSYDYEIVYLPPGTRDHIFNIFQYEKVRKAASCAAETRCDDVR
jgi:Methyltransferase domain